MANHASHAALPYPVKGARFTILVPYLDADGDPTDPTTPDTEISKDDGSAADTAEEVASPKNSVGMLTLTGAEMDCSCASVAAKAASGPKTTLATLYPRVLAAIFSGTASAGANGSITLATDIPAVADLLVGCIVKTTGGTGGGGTGGANNQARVITDFTTGRVASVVPNWETNPSSDTTYEILLTEAALLRFSDLRLWKGSAPADLTNTDKVQVSVAHWTVATPPTAVQIQAELEEDGASLLDTLTDRLTATRAGFLDKLNISGNVAASSEVTAIQNNTRVVRVVPDVIERPDAGSTTYRVELLLYDSVGNMEAPDSAPTIELVNQAGTDRSSRLDSTTMASVSAGRYRAIYTASSGDAIEQLVWTFSVVEGGATRQYGNASLIVDTTAVDFTAADRAKLDTLHDTRLTAGRATNLDNLDATVSTRSSQASVDTIGTNVVSLVNRLGAFTGTGINTVLGFFRALFNKAGGLTPSDLSSGAGGDNTTDSLEAIRDRGDATWGAGSVPTVGQIADGVWDEPRAGHTAPGTFGNYLDAPITSVGGGGGGGPIGPGGIEHTLTIRTTAGMPVGNVHVWITTDQAGGNVIAGTLDTNSQGKVTFMLDAGTYYFWCEKAGMNFTNPGQFTVA
jgi:hypothetical protein